MQPQVTFTGRPSLLNHVLTERAGARGPDP